MDAVTTPPTPSNEPTRTYAPGSAERASLEAKVKELAGERVELTTTIGGVERMAGGDRYDVVQPHRHAAVLGSSAEATDADVAEAVDAALAAGPAWRDLPFDERAAVLLRAAELLAGPWRDTLNAATMLGQSKSSLPGRDRRGRRAHRLPPLQRALRPAGAGRAAALEPPACGTGWTTGRWRASSSRSRRSTSPRSPATCRWRRR